jgi:hypothetical protein
MSPRCLAWLGLLWYSLLGIGAVGGQGWLLVCSARLTRFHFCTFFSYILLLLLWLCFLRLAKFFMETSTAHPFTGQLYKINSFGEAHHWKCFTCILNVFLTPVLLIVWFFSIYVYPCFINCLGTCCCNVLFHFSFCKQLLTFVDGDFPCSDENGGGTGIKWRRIHELAIPAAVDKMPTTGSSNKVATIGRLFDGIDPSDIAQGQLGDCWLLAALATLAEKPQYIQNCFVTRSFNPRGQYVVRLYDKKAAKYVNVTIDDYIPCDAQGCPLYTQIGSNEMWPLLIEKAFAKLRGGYGKLDGGSPLDALQTITGFTGERIVFSSSSNLEQLFQKLRKCALNKCIVACGSLGVDRTRDEGRGSVKGSIVGGHAYSILGVYEPTLTTEKVRLVKLRNPWGSFEWQGDWSDSSSHWKTYPGVALEVGKPPVVDDGIFFMAWKDFVQHFDLIDILYPQVNIADLHITVHEEVGMCGPALGCLLGSAKFWCLCQGLYTLWCQKSSRRLQKELEFSEV